MPVREVAAGNSAPFHNRGSGSPEGSHNTLCVLWVLVLVFRSDGVACPSPAPMRSDILCHRQSPPRASASRGCRIRAGGRHHPQTAPETGLPVFGIRADAGSLALSNLARISAHHLAGHPGYQVDFIALPESEVSLALMALGPPAFGIRAPEFGTGARSAPVPR